ncbi:MAG: hypothetical protein H0T65_17045 [Deltaproteobacteria bacterium]|nr:hypothetical protein [Deltaproteobacteria bacterium]
MAALVTILFVGGLIVVILIGNEKQKKKLEMTFGWMGEKLGGGKDVEQRLAWGDVGGAKIWFRMTTRGSGKSTTYWTEVDAEIPEKYPLLLLVRKHGWLDKGKIERGEMVDVVVGDAEFDERFLVEAAPAEVARILLDPRERSYLLQLVNLQFDIDTIRTAEKPVLRLSVRDWIYDINDAMRACEAMAAIAGRVRAAYAAVESATEARDVGSPYRPQLDDTEARGAAEARLAEVARVDGLRTSRLANQQAFAVVMVLLFVVFAMIAIASGS